MASLLQVSCVALTCAAPLLAIAGCGGGGAGSGGSTATSTSASSTSSTSGMGGGGFFFDAGSHDGMSTDGCTPVDAGNVADASTGCEGLAGGVHFAADLGPILTQSCNGDNCHAVPSYSSLVSFKGASVHAYECCDGRLVVMPGNAARSYLMDKITGHGMCAGGQMPLAKPALADADMLTIRRWICEGAPDD